LGAGSWRDPPFTTRGVWLVAALALVSEADDRNGERMVLRWWLWPPVCLRSRDRRRRGAVRAFRDQLGHFARRRRDQSRGRPYEHARRHVSRTHGRADRRQKGGGVEARQ